MKPWRDPFVWIGVLLIAAAWLGGLWGVMALTRAPARLGLLPARVTVLPAASPTPTPSPTPSTPTPTPTPLAPPPPAGLTVEAVVQIRGTGGDGLRVRQAPSLAAPVLFLAAEGEVFRVAEGPKEHDGFTWWRIVSTHDERRQGWAVSNYLAVLKPTPTPAP